VDLPGRRLKIEAHDASRVEWSIYLPLPRDKTAFEAEVDLHLEFPENVYAPHDGWDQLQILTRLSSPDDDAPGAAPTSDGVRRSALGYARKMKLLRESIPRAAVAHSLNPMPFAPSLAKDLAAILDKADALLLQARELLTRKLEPDSAEMQRERDLADEFLSGQLLELLTVAEETSRRMRQPGALPQYRELAEKLNLRVEEMLSRELRERESRGELLPDGEDGEALALFLDRAASLKKHFQEVLFLEPEAQMIDQAVRNWVGLSGAATAFVIYFGLQALQTSAAAQASLGIGTLMTAGALAYALKDRAKELTRQWLSGKLSHLYAQRVLLLREPQRYDRSRNVVMKARESLAQSRISQPDPLNPGTGAVQRVVIVDYKQRARVTRLRGPTGAVYERLKVVFRYDLSPILSRLDDSVKRVPVPDSGGVRFADVPRLYRVPMSVSLTTAAGVEKRDVVIVLSRRGIARLASFVEPPQPLAELELPDLDELPDLLPQS
jgi:hypothetical protein